MVQDSQDTTRMTTAPPTDNDPPPQMITPNEDSDGDAGTTPPPRFIDLFCGMGGFHLALKTLATCVYACDNDRFACKTYEANFGVSPQGDITAVSAADIPPHDLLCAGFPCQSFSTIGRREGFDHPTKGTLFFDIARILAHHQPAACFLENVKGLLSHDRGQTFAVVRSTLQQLGYHLHVKVLDAADFGLPAHRKRVYIVGFRAAAVDFTWPTPTHQGNHVGIGPFLEQHDTGYCIYPQTQRYLFKKDDGRPRIVTPETTHPANTLVATYHKVQRLTGTFVKDGATGYRLLSSNECKAMLGFPSGFQIPTSRTQMYRQLGNSVAVPVVRAIAQQICRVLPPPQGNPEA